MANCPICGNPLEGISQDGDNRNIHCLVCGIFNISGTAQGLLSSQIESNPGFSDKVLLALKEQQANDPVPFITSNWLYSIIDSPTAMSPSEQAKSLILWIGERYTANPQIWLFVTEVRNDNVPGIVGFEALDYVLANLEEQGYIHTLKASLGGGIIRFRLTFKGWEYHSKLKTDIIYSRFAFMAMPFRRQDIRDNYKNFYKPTVADTGYELNTVDENPQAGNITNKILLDIQKARFVIAELTYGNNGVYWEAGYAEGLKKPVIYTCNKDWSKENGTHFDIRNHLTVFWTEDTIEEAMDELKATIRITIPEANQEDPLPQVEEVMLTVS